MRVFAVLYAAKESVSSESILSSYESLTEFGNLVTCLVPGRRGHVSSSKTGFSVQQVNVGPPIPLLPFIVFNVLVLWKFIRFRVWPDVIIFEASVTPALTPIVLLARALRKPATVFRIESTPVETSGFSGLLSKAIFEAGLILSRAGQSGILAISPMQRDEMVDRHRIPARRIGVWTVRVNKDLFDPKKYVKERTGVRKTLGITSADFLLIYHGSYSPTRGLLPLVNGFAVIKRSHANIKLLLLGDGEFLHVIRASINEKALAGTVLIHPPVSLSEVPLFLAAGDAGVSPLPNHPFWRNQPPLKVLEFLSMGIPVVASNMESHRWIMGFGPHVTYFESNSVDGIVQAVLDLYDKRAELPALAPKIRELAISRFATNVVGSQANRYLCRLVFGRDDTSNLELAALPNTNCKGKRKGSV